MGDGKANSLEQVESLERIDSHEQINSPERIKSQAQYETNSSKHPNTSPLNSSQKAPNITIQTWISSTLLAFALRHLPANDPFLANLVNENPLVSHLKAKSKTQNSTELSAGLEAGVKQIQQDQLMMSDALQQLIQDLKLPLWQLCILSLCAQAEENFTINMLLNRLQQSASNTVQPSQSIPRAQLHLLIELVAVLFDRSVSVSELLALPIVKMRIVECEGESVLASRYLVFNHQWLPLFCSESIENMGLSGRAVNIEDEQVLPLIAENMLTEIKYVTQQLKQDLISSIIMRGEYSMGLIIANQIAKSLKLKLRIFEQHEYSKYTAIACHYAKVLPVVKLALAPAQTYSITTIDHLFVSKCVYLLGTSGFVTNAVEHNNSGNRHQLYSLNIQTPPMLQRQHHWQQQLGSTKDVDSLFLAQSALLSTVTIKQIYQQARLFAQVQNRSIQYGDIVKARVHLCAGQLTDIAQPVHWHITKEAFISSSDVERQLNVLVKRCSVREKLGTGLGSALQTTLNTGVTALFYGASGAGKTLAASIVASQLATPLYRIDLAGLMNKYIGETEKNLSKALDKAAESDVILLLDEADALFGQRSDASNSGDRFANMLTNYLLTRIETHPGIVILTSNAKERIDSAFTRRLDSVVEFRLPNAKQRFALLCHHFGSRIPSQSFCQFLGDYCELSGGFIRNIVLNSAAIDAGVQGDAINEFVVLECVIDEYLKLGRALPSEVTLYYKRLKAAAKGR